MKLRVKSDAQKVNLGIFRTRGIGRSIFSFFFYKTVRRTRIKALKFDRVSALPIDCPSQAEVNVVLMYGGDVLGKEGRKALNACVKVKIFGRPHTRLYDYGTTLVSPGGGAFANFALLGGRAFANPRAIPELLTRTRFPIRI